LIPSLLNTLKHDITFDGLTNFMEENRLRINGDELYSEYTVFLSVAEELIKTDVSTDQKVVNFSAKMVLQISWKS
jgi:hypothetical protein